MMPTRRTVLVVPFPLLEPKGSCGCATDLLLFEAGENRFALSRDLVMDGPPPLFNQGVSARARLAFFSFLAVALIIIDSRIKVLETVRVGLGVVLYPVQQALLVPGRIVGVVGDYFTSVSALQRENETLKRRQVESAQALLQAQQMAEENDRLRKLLSARERSGNRAILGTVLYESRDAFHTRSCCMWAPTMACAQPSGHRRHRVVGQVTRAFNNTAEVTLLTDKDQSIPIQIVRNGLRGVAFGGADPGTLDLRFMAAMPMSNTAISR